MTPITKMETCLNTDTNCRAVGTWISTDYKTKPFPETESKACFTACGLNDANSVVKSTAKCMEGCTIFEK